MTLIDAHAHLWDRALFHYGWLEGQSDLPFTFLPDDLAATGEEISTAVFVQADCAPAQAIEEAEWVEALRRQGAAIAGIVAYAPLERPDRDGILDALSRVEGVVGVRRLLQDEPADIFDSPELVAGIGGLAARGWTFDACVRVWQLPLLERLARQIPDVPIVLDHLGKPPVTDMSSFDSWRVGITALAALPHVSIKLSGMISEAPRGTRPTAYGPWLRAAVDAFGVDRCMVGSDWPVSSLDGLSRSDWFHIVRDGLALDEGEWNRVAGATARSFYHLSS